jgi:hypothetical protein
VTRVPLQGVFHQFLLNLSKQVSTDAELARRIGVPRQNIKGYLEGKRRYVSAENLDTWGTTGGLNLTASEILAVLYKLAREMEGDVVLAGVRLPTALGVKGEMSPEFARVFQKAKVIGKQQHLQQQNGKKKASGSGRARGRKPKAPGAALPPPSGEE